MKRGARYSQGDLAAGRPFGRVARGLTLIEATVSLLIVGTMLVAALSAAAAARTTERKLADEVQGVLLAHALMSEIVALSYADPQTGPGAMLLEVDEIGDGSRALWDDVDDYNGFSESGPRLKDGTALAGFSDWRWTASVTWVSPNNLQAGLGADSGVKLIRVRALRNGAEACVLLSIRTSKSTVTTELDGLLGDVVDITDTLLGILRVK